MKNFGFFLISAFIHELFSLLRLQNTYPGLYRASYKLGKYLHIQDHNFNICITVILPKV